MSQVSHTETSVAQKQLEKKIIELQKKTYLPQELVLLMAEVSRIQLAAEETVSFGRKQDNDSQVSSQASSQTCAQTCMSSCAEPDVPTPSLHDVADKVSCKASCSLPGNLPITTPSRHAQGEPVLLREHFPLDYASLPVITHNIFNILGSVSSNLQQYGNALQKALDNKTFSLEEACRSIVAQPISLDEKSYFHTWAKNNPGAPYFFSFIAASCVLPSAKVAGKLLAEHHDANSVWPHGHCPICGSLPLMGRLVKTEGFRMHTCSFCLHEFKATRMACPFCLSTGDEKDNYFASEDEPGYQLHVCHDCNNYCKIADFREFDRLYLPVLDDLSSLVLDMYARKKGYLRPTLSAWGA